MALLHSVRHARAPEREECRCAEKERWLADGFRRVDRPWVRCVGKKFHAHVDWNVVERRNLVGTRASREQGARLRPLVIGVIAPNQFFHGE